MTKYILHGGYSRVVNADNNAFFQEMTADYPKGNIKILLCYFARPAEDVKKCFADEKEFFYKNSKNKNIILEITDEHKLADQIKKAHVFYLAGGETSWLINKLKLTPNLSTLVKGKTVAGSSAGAYAISKYYFSNDHQNLGEGLGFLNIKNFCHYKQGNENNIQKLTNYKEKLPVIILPDHKWQVIYQ